MTQLERARRRTHEILEIGTDGDAFSRWVDRGLIGLVALNVLAVILQSVESFSLVYEEAFAAFEFVSVGVFTIEFALRLWSSADSPGAGTTAWKRRARYLRSPLAVADLLAIAPFYLATILSADLRFLRILRLLRVLKLTRYSLSLIHI